MYVGIEPWMLKIQISANSWLSNAMLIKKYWDIRAKNILQCTCIALSNNFYVSSFNYIYVKYLYMYTDAALPEGRQFFQYYGMYLPTKRFLGVSLRCACAVRSKMDETKVVVDSSNKTWCFVLDMLWKMQGSYRDYLLAHRANKRQHYMARQWFTLAMGRRAPVSVGPCKWLLLYKYWPVCILV